jgi:hypothetical protein
LSAVAARRFNRIFVAAIVVDFVVVGKADLIFLGSYLVPLFLCSPSHFVFLCPAGAGWCCVLYRLLLVNFVLLSKGFGVDAASATVRQRIFKKPLTLWKFSGNFVSRSRIPPISILRSVSRFDVFCMCMYMCAGFLYSFLQVERREERFFLVFWFCVYASPNPTISAVLSSMPRFVIVM